jgi:hypothetical protein
MDNHPAIAALKATAPHRFSPMPWKPDTAPGDDEPMIRDANGDDVGRFAVAEDRDHALSATLAAPHLLARVAELEAALETARVAVEEMPTIAHTVDCNRLTGRGRCDCDMRELLYELRLALGLEVK